MRKKSSAIYHDKNREAEKKSRPSAAYRILMLGVILVATGIIAHVIDGLIGTAQSFQRTGATQFSFLANLYPYRESVKVLADMALLPGIALVVGPVLFFIMKTEVMKARVMVTGIPVPVVIKAVSQYEAWGRNGGFLHYATAFELEVRPPGEAPFHASVKEKSEDVYNTEYVTGSTIAALYDQHTKIVRIPEPSFNEAEHNRRARKLARSVWFMIFTLVIKFLKKKTGLFIWMLIIVAAGVTVLLTVVEDVLMLALFATTITTGMFIGVYAGLTTSEIPEFEEQEEQKRYTPQPFKGVR